MSDFVRVCDLDSETFTTHHTNWRTTLSRAVVHHGIPILPDEDTMFDICLLSEQNKKVFLKFRSYDLYLIAYKRVVGKWQEIRPSSSDPWLLGHDADRLDFCSNYGSLRTAGRLDSDVTALKINKSMLNESINDLANENCARYKKARGLLRILAMFPESCRLTQLENFCRARCVYDYEDGRHSEDPHFGFDGKLDSLTKNWNNLCEIIAQNADFNAQPQLLARYELNNEDGMPILTVQAARAEVKLLHGKCRA